EVRLLACLPSGHGHRVAGLQRLAAPPPLAHEHVRRETFETPLGNGAVLTLHLEREMNVRIDPLDARDGARQRHGLFAVEDRGERMMGTRGAGREERRHEDETRLVESQLVLPSKRLAAAVRVWFRP